MKSEVESGNCRSPGLLREADRCLYPKLIRIEICHFSFFSNNIVLQLGCFMSEVKLQTTLPIMREGVLRVFSVMHT